MKRGELASNALILLKHFDCTRIDAYVNSGENKIHQPKTSLYYKFCFRNITQRGDENTRLRI
jgi:hypothetical protein